MSFPINPTDGQQTIQNSITYVYSSATNSWKRSFNNLIDRLVLTGTYESTNTATGTLVTYGGAGIGGQLSAQTLKSFSTATASPGTGSLVVAGGAYISSNLYIASTDYNTGTATSNSLYVAGGANVNDLTVRNSALFQGPVIFQGTATYVFSVNTQLTESLVDLHVNGTRETPWTFDDGNDIGHVFHYYSGAADVGDSNTAFLGISNDTKYLEWFSDGTSTTSSYVGSTYGTFRTGNILLKGTDNSISTTTGSLQVAGGTGIGLDLFVGGSVTVADTADSTNTATGALIVGGGAGFAKSVHVGDIAVINGDSANPDGVSENALQVTVGGFGVEGSAYIGGTVKLASVAISNNTSSGALAVAGGVGIGGSLNINGTISRVDAFSGPTWANIGGVAVNIAAATYTDTTGLGEVAGVSSAVWLGQPTFASDITATYSDAATLYIQNSPIAGANTLLTSTYSLLVENGIVRINTTATSTGTNSGAFIVAGGVGVGGAVYAAELYDSADRVITTATIYDYLPLPIAAGGDISITSSTDYLLIATTSTLQSVTDRGNTTTNSISFANTAQSFNTITGAVVVSGGLGVGGSVYADNLYDTDARVLTSVTVDVGDGLSGGGTITGPTGTVTITNTGVIGIAGTANQILVNGNTDINSGTVTLSIPLEFITNTGSFTTLSVTGTAEATSTTGALVVAGGTSIVKDLYVGGTIYGTIFGAGSADISTSLAGGAAGTVPYQADTGVTAFVSTGTTGTIFTANGTGAPSWNNSLELSSTTASTSTTTGALVVAGGVGVGGDVVVEGTGQFSSAGVKIGNVQVGSYTSSTITTGDIQDLDSFAATEYRTAKYLVQVIDGSFIHISELIIFHDDIDVYINEYGISTNQGDLGVFDANISAGVVTFTFEPNYIPDAMVISLSRTVIAL